MGGRRNLQLRLVLAWCGALSAFRAPGGGPLRRIAPSTAGTAGSLRSVRSRPVARSAAEQRIEIGKIEQSDKFWCVYTCGRCDTRNAVHVHRVSWDNGMVVATCSGCEARHLLADNRGRTDKLNQTQFSNAWNDALDRGIPAQRVTQYDAELFKELGVELLEDGNVSLVPREGETALRSFKNATDRIQSVRTTRPKAAARIQTTPQGGVVVSEPKDDRVSLASPSEDAESDAKVKALIQTIGEAIEESDEMREFLGLPPKEEDELYQQRQQTPTQSSTTGAAKEDPAASPATAAVNGARRDPSTAREEEDSSSEGVEDSEMAPPAVVLPVGPEPGDVLQLAIPGWDRVHVRVPDGATPGMTLVLGGILEVRAPAAAEEDAILPVELPDGNTVRIELKGAEAVPGAAVTIGFPVELVAPVVAGGGKDAATGSGTTDDAAAT